ncbi:tail protein [Xenorhabdus mauleonii]|uniref:Phage tail fibre repeat-containing protein n=1 Tax=Xenorhabdus mauleonii TaxID=351675 RepID=A0A1I3YKU4_9GAMM|nr:phage tail protein [Xenorhabdus mauleonii]PHM33555.1 tail protein [Xenorhabdus mauleonii]SFK32435.1 Phage tail fibre repeat-containing protein [Xenorhabdus mauleonii]
MSTQDNKLNTPYPEDCDLFMVPSRKYVKGTVESKVEEHAQSRNHPYATQEEPGFVTLSNETDSSSEITVATSKAVKKAYDLANTANQNALNSSNRYLEKKQNGADILDKAEFVKNIGLSELVYKTVGNGPNQVPDMNSFDSSLNESGYQKLPSGLIIQWGVVIGGQNPNDLRKFPIPFKNKCFVVTGSYALGGDWGQGISAEVKSKEEFLIVVHDSLGGWSGSRVQYIAIGY